MYGLGTRFLVYQALYTKLNGGGGEEEMWEEENEMWAEYFCSLQALAVMTQNQRKTGHISVIVQ